jgi:hypothetical protein
MSPPRATTAGSSGLALLRRKTCRATAHDGPRRSLRCRRLSLKRDKREAKDRKRDDDQLHCDLPLFRRYAAITGFIEF